MPVHSEPEERRPIANIEAEAALLGALMIDNGLIDTVSEKLANADFSDAYHAEIFDALVRERALGRVANPVTLHPYFRDCSDERKKYYDGAAYLAQLTGSGAAVIGVHDFADQLLELSRRRQLIDRLGGIIADAADWNINYDEFVVAAEGAINDVSADTTDGTVEMSLAAAMTLALESEEESGGVRCGIESIDNALGPIQPKELVILAGRPGMGKTVVGMSYALGVVRARQDISADQVRDGVLYFSLEMSAKQLGMRAAADLCFDGERGVYYGNIVDRRLHGEQGREVARAIERVREVPLEIVDASRMTVGRLNSTIRRYKRRMAAKGVTLRLVVVDYLQLVQPDQREKDLYTRITEVSKGLKACAKANDVGLLALAQLSRDVEKRGGDKRPNLADLRDSGQIEQDADGVVFLFRHEYYLRKEEPAETDPKRPAWEASIEAKKGQIEYIVAKRRERPESIGRGRFYGAFQAVR